MDPVAEVAAAMVSSMFARVIEAAPDAAAPALEKSDQAAADARHEKKPTEPTDECTAKPATMEARCVCVRA